MMMGYQQKEPSVAGVVPTVQLGEGFNLVKKLSKNGQKIKIMKKNRKN